VNAETASMWSVESPHWVFRCCAVFPRVSLMLYFYFSLYIRKTLIGLSAGCGKSLQNPDPQCGGLHVLHIRSGPFPRSHEPHQ
jgi:hypothetical protein